MGTHHLLALTHPELGTSTLSYTRYESRQPSVEPRHWFFVNHDGPLFLEATMRRMEELLGEAGVEAPWLKVTSREKYIVIDLSEEEAQRILA